MASVRALLLAGPNHLGAAQPLTVTTSDIIPPLLHTQVMLLPLWVKAGKVSDGRVPRGWESCRQSLA